MEKDLTAIVTELMRQGMTKEDLAKSFTTATKEAQDILYKEEDELIEQHPWDYPDKGALCKYYDKLVRKELDTESGLVLLLAIMKQLVPELDISEVTLDEIKAIVPFFKTTFKDTKTERYTEYDVDKLLDEMLSYFEL
ncbi:hypothetical protein [Megamonas funiformis]|uniref:hypothetical protein n=1 Tax=Megamonas funiformis TaxID=437897 RepID=UPI003F82013D